MEQRRKDLCLNYAKKSIKNETLSDLFPLNENKKETRNKEKYIVTHANTDRLRNSSIIYMQNLLNEEDRQLRAESMMNKRYMDKNINYVVTYSILDVFHCALS